MENQIQIKSWKKSEGKNLNYKSDSQFLIRNHESKKEMKKYLKKSVGRQKKNINLAWHT